jgi:FkbM family methyltransferase
VDYAFRPLSLPDGRRVELALPVGSNDPVVQSYAAGAPLNAYLIDWLTRFSEPGARVLDLGCHVGTLAVPAAALGRRVIAVDASPLHVGAVRRSAERNHLDLLSVEWCAIAARDGEVEFDENGLWGMVSRDGTSVPGRLRVPARRADGIVLAAGWSGVDFVKMDVEGSELAAIEGLGALLTGPAAPFLVYESNGMTFEMFGYTIVDIRRRLENLGYITCRVERDDLVYCPPTELQPEAWLDVVALPPAWRRRYGRIAPAWAREDMIARCLEWGTSEHRNVREYLHRAFAADTAYPENDRRLIDLRRRLADEFGPTAIPGRAER